MHVGCVCDGPDVAGAVPRRLDVEALGDGRNLARLRQPADVPDVAANEINQLLGEQRQCLPARVEQLAHCQRRGRVLADQAEALFVLRAQRVFQEEQVIRLKFLRQPRRLNRVQPLVDIVQELDLFAQRHAQVFQQPGDNSQIRPRLKPLHRGQ